jgi:L-threonylcarbamoyladenylate synthase
LAKDCRSDGGFLKTQIIRLDPGKVEAPKIRIIAGNLSRGGVIVYPTDTYYGLGADCYLEEALRRVYKLKKRQSSKPLPVLVADIGMARKIAADIPPSLDSLAAEFWPGPLTVVLKAAAFLPDKLVGNQRTIGVRLPAVPWIRELVEQADFPIVATSANISGQGEIASAQKVIEVFDHRVDLIVDGGETPGRLPSTVVDLTSGKMILVREGAIPKSRLSRYLT